jgi:hypothetical protein
MIRDTNSYKITFTPDPNDFTLQRNTWVITKPVVEWYAKFCGKQKVNAIKSIREYTGLPLREAKDMVDMIEALATMINDPVVVDPFTKLGQLVRYDNELL